MTNPGPEQVKGFCQMRHKTKNKTLNLFYRQVVISYIRLFVHFSNDKGLSMCAKKKSPSHISGLLLSKSFVHDQYVHLQTVVLLDSDVQNSSLVLCHPFIWFC